MLLKPLIIKTCRIDIYVVLGKIKECEQFEVHKNKVHDNTSVKRQYGDRNDEYKDCQRNFLAHCKTDEVHIVNLN